MSVFVYIDEYGKDKKLYILGLNPSTMHPPSWP